MIRNKFRIVDKPFPCKKNTSHSFLFCKHTLARPSCSRFSSLQAHLCHSRWSETTEAISLPLDRHTTFAMTTLHLPALLAANFLPESCHYIFKTERSNDKLFPNRNKFSLLLKQILFSF